MNTPRYSESELQQLARKRAGAKLGWYLHAVVYVLVNAMLALLSLRSLRSAQHGALLPALGWGLGLVLHGAAVWLALPGSGLRARLEAQERRQLQVPRDPW